MHVTAWLAAQKEGCKLSASVCVCVCVSEKERAKETM